MTFGNALRDLRRRTDKSRYRLAQYTGIDQAYILRLETGERTHPSRDVVMMLALALVENSEAVTVDDIDEMLLSAGYAPFRRRRQREPTLAS